MVPTHEYFMQQALKEAHKALEADEVPIGAVIVMQERIIARGFNQVETLKMLCPCGNYCPYFGL